jgi:hypothetical protein
MSITPQVNPQESSEAQRAAQKYTSDSIQESIKSKATIAATVAMLLQLLTKVALEGVKGLLGQNKSRQNQKKDSQLEQLSDYLPNDKKITQRLGNKTRGISRIFKGKTSRGLSKAASKTRSLGKAAKLGNTLSKVKNVGRAGRFAKTLGIAKNAGIVAKRAKTANTAYKAVKVAKLANTGRILATGGVALAGGPVGIAVLTGSVIAPIAIEAVWKNREKIYDGGKKLVNHSKIATADIGAMVKGKTSKPGEVVPELAGMKVTGDDRDKTTLLEADDQGKILTNKFAPEQKLAFYQEKNGEKSMLLDEADLYPNQATSIVNPAGVGSSKAEVSGISVVSNTLTSLAGNNPGNPEIQKQTAFLGNNLTQAQANIPVKANVQESIKLNEAGSSIINLFNSELPPKKRNQTLETEDYSISRRGNDYFLKDKSGNLLLQATNTGFGTKIKSSNLNPAQKEDLGYLKEDLRLNEGITGGFMPKIPQAIGKNEIAASTPAKSAQEAARTYRAAEETSAVSSSTAKPRSTFSQYLPTKEQEPALTGNNKVKSNNMER